MVTYNSANYLPALIDSLRAATKHQSIRLIAVDNQSSDSTLGVLALHDDIVIIHSGGNVGYSAGINLGMRSAGNCDHLLILNPDLTVAPDAIAKMIAATHEPRVGAVAPQVIDDNGTLYPSVRNEPSLLRCFFDSIIGPEMCSRLGLPRETDFRPDTYSEPHSIDWATGAALLIPLETARLVGEWNESFFLYSEEVDYCRRIRNQGLCILYEPSAVVVHRVAGSGQSNDLLALMAVNRIRYIEMNHGVVYSILFRGIALLGYGLRSFESAHRRTFAIVANRRRWKTLPSREDGSRTG